MLREPFRIQVEFELAEEVPGLDLALYLTTHSGSKVFDESLSDHHRERLPAGAHCAELSVPAGLNVGNYTVGLWIGTKLEDFIHEPAALTFTLSGNTPDRPDRLLALRLPFAVHRLTATS